MILKSRGLSYETKYEYGQWTPSISHTNKHTFTIINKETEEYFSEYSSDSFLEAEEMVFEKFFMGKNCEHSWHRKYSNGKAGECVKCMVCHPSKFSSPYSCDHEGCNKSADFSISFEPDLDNNYCLNHYIENLNKNVEIWREKGFGEIDSCDKDYNLSVIFKSFVVNALVEFDGLKEKSLREQELILKELDRNYPRIQLSFFAEEGRKIGVDINNGQYWKFQYALDFEDALFFAYRYVNGKEWLSEDKKIELNILSKNTLEKALKFIKIQ